MRGFILGFISAFLLIAVAGYAYLELGLAPVATDAAALPFEKMLAHMALKAAIAKDAPTTPAIQPSDEVYLEGAKIYQNNCAVCHGLPDQSRTAIAKGEFPPPPVLFSGKGVTDDPAGVTYWKVAHGIRLSGMPGFEKNLSPDQIWQVSLFLANADKLPANVRTALAAPVSVNPTSAK